MEIDFEGADEIQLGEDFFLDLSALINNSNLGDKFTLLIVSPSGTDGFGFPDDGDEPLGLH